MVFYDLSSRELRSQLPPRPKTYWHRIVPNHHVGIRVSRTNGATWVTRIRAETGGYKSCTFGQATLLGSNGHRGCGFGFEYALKKAKEFRRNQHKMGMAASPFSLHYNGQMTICPIGKIITVGHALHHFIEWRRIAAASSTFTSNLSQINYHLVPRVANIPLAEFNGEHFYALCKDVLETPPKKGKRRLESKLSIQKLPQEELRKRKKTLNTLICILRTAFTLAWDRNELHDDRPIRCLRMLPAHERPRPNYLTRPQCHKLIEASEPYLRNLIIAALYTGCRVGELIDLKAQDVANQGFGVFIARSKNHRTRFVFLPKEGMAFFLQLCLDKEPQELILTHPKGTHWGRRYKHAFNGAIDRTGLPKSSCFHTLRHSYASQLVEDGAPLSIIARQLGHSSTMTVDKVYGHLSPSWSEHTIDRHFAKLQHGQELTDEIEKQIQDLLDDPTGLARKGNDKRREGPYSKNDTMPAYQGDISWPRNNHSLFQGPLLKQIAPKRNNAPDG